MYYVNFIIYFLSGWLFFWWILLVTYFPRSHIVPNIPSFLSQNISCKYKKNEMDLCVFYLLPTEPAWLTLEYYRLLIKIIGIRSSTFVHCLPVYSHIVYNTLAAGNPLGTSNSLQQSTAPLITGLAKLICIDFYIPQLISNVHVGSSPATDRQKFSERNKTVSWRTCCCGDYCEIV